MEEQKKENGTIPEEAKETPRKLAHDLRGTRAKVGKASPVSGLFRCVKCGTEVTLKKGRIVPLCPACKGLSFEIVAE